MAADISANILRLKTEYERAQKSIIDKIISFEAKGNVTAYQKTLLASINQELSVLNDFTAKWMAEELPKSYSTGINEAYKSFRAAKIDASLVAANQTVLKNLIDNTTNSLVDGSNYVGRRIADEVRAAGIEAIAEKVATGSTVRETKKRLLERLSQKGVTKILDSAGREIDMSAYATMVARTTTREATNQGTIQELNDNGYDLVKMSTTFSTCPICAPLEGRVYSVSGNNKKYPALSNAFSDGYHTIHPNCTHVLEPYFEEFDDDHEKTLKESNRPFEIDPKKQRSVDNYYKEQKKKQQRWRDRKAYEKMRLADPDNAPKTFSAFRSKKRAGTLPKIETPRLEKLPPFIAAASKEEAEAFAKQFVNQTVSYRGVDLDVANQVNKALYDNRIGSKLDKLEYIKPEIFKNDSNAYASMGFPWSVLKINTKTMKSTKVFNGFKKAADDAWESVFANIERLTEAQKIKALKYQKAGKSLVKSDTPYDMIVHEIGHHVLNMTGQSKSEIYKTLVIPKMEENFAKLSGYASFNFQEFFAESYVAYRNGLKDKVMPELIKIFDEVLK